MVCDEFSFIDTAHTNNEVKIVGRLLEGAKSRPCQKDIENFDRPRLHCNAQGVYYSLVLKDNHPVHRGEINCF